MSLLVLIGVGVYMIGHGISFYPVPAPFASIIMVIGGMLVIVGAIVGA